MLRIVLAVLFTASFIFGIADLIENGMYLQLALVCLAAFGFGVLITTEIYSK